MFQEHHVLHLFFWTFMKVNVEKEDFISKLNEVADNGKVPIQTAVEITEELLDRLDWVTVK